MSQCQCQGIESLFDQRLAATQLERVRRRGPQKTTRLLVEALRARGVQGRTLLDIGGGVGAIQHQLLASGVREAVDVDASSAYLRAARSEAERLGFEGRVRYHYGNFLDLAHGIPPADIVTLDRVICCYDDMDGLVGMSADRAQLLYGLVYPRDAWWTRLGIRLMNLGQKLRGNPFRVFAHGTSAVESILESRGLVRSYHRTAGLWQVAVFSRQAAPA
jgi:magnesium-protoporphyrin O-methyltransferase